MDSVFCGARGRMSTVELPIEKLTMLEAGPDYMHRLTP